METPHERLKKLRLDLGLSGEEFASMMGVKSSSLVYWYEDGGGKNHTFLNKYKLEKLAEKTGVRKEWLLTGDGPQFGEKKTIQSTPGSPELKKRIIELTIGKDEELHIILRSA